MTLLGGTRPSIRPENKLASGSKHHLDPNQSSAERKSAPQGKG